MLILDLLISGTRLKIVCSSVDLSFIFSRKRNASMIVSTVPPASLTRALAVRVCASCVWQAEASGVPPVMREGAVHGWVYKRGGLKSKAWKRRYAVYEPRACRGLCIPCPSQPMAASSIAIQCRTDREDAALTARMETHTPRVLPLRYAPFHIL